MSHVRPCNVSGRTCHQKMARSPARPGGDVWKPQRTCVPISSSGAAAVWGQSVTWPCNSGGSWWRWCSGPLGLTTRVIQVYLTIGGNLNPSDLSEQLTRRLLLSIVRCYVASPPPLSSRPCFAAEVSAGSAGVSKSESVLVNTVDVSCVLWGQALKRSQRFFCVIGCKACVCQRGLTLPDRCEGQTAPQLWMEFRGNRQMSPQSADVTSQVQLRVHMQLAMSDRTSVRMPERMSEDMSEDTPDRTSERMSEDMPGDVREELSEEMSERI